MFKPHIYTVEGVTSGHPDKVCDQISDAVLDACLTEDPESRVAVETFGSHGLLVVGGEITSRTVVDFEALARQVYREIGYEDDLRVITNVVQQSPDIAQGVDTGGAGDQGIMYGYATSETEEYLPKAVVLAHCLTRGLEELRRTDPKFSWLKPDGKAQVTMEGDRVRTVLVSCQHDEAVTQAEIRTALVACLIGSMLGDLEGVEVLVNPTGKFVIGGFAADTGLTGRKIMVDTYGGFIPHGGGCFSGKDPTKVDRSAAYMARFAAKNIVARGLSDEVLVSVAYAIGRAEPVMVHATGGNGENLNAYVSKHFDFRPRAIIERLDLKRPFYRQTAAYGHFGKREMPWEKIA
ncbi:MAG: methionine adenosyltransferase [bacterium]|nr:methionine adenosyltransferase [bacterium]